MKAIIFDMGNTLIEYWSRKEWLTVLGEGIESVVGYLSEHELMLIPKTEIDDRVQAQRGESEDHAVVPLLGRLLEIFELKVDQLPDGTGEELCARFMVPLFARGKMYDDVLPVLQDIRSRGLVSGILSNSPWGSPATLWHQEMARYGLAEAVDVVVFCEDVGFRKPASQPFEYITAKLGVDPSECVFVGDDPKWDIAGPTAVGMRAVLIDRLGENADLEMKMIHDLNELLTVL